MRQDYTKITKQCSMIYKWKKRGLIHNNYKQLYDLYLLNKNCSKCNCKYTKDNKKCMDHCHISNKFRQFLCNRCNCNNRQIKKSSTGIPNIIFDKKYNKFKYQKQYKKINYQKHFNTLEEANDYKIIFEKSLLTN